MGTVPASLTPGHFQNTEKSRSAILSVFAEFRAGPRGSTRRNGVASAYKTFHKIQKMFQFFIPGFVGVDTDPMTLSLSQPGDFRMQKSGYLRMGLARREINVRRVILKSIVPVRTHLHRGDCIAEACHSSFRFIVICDSSELG